MLYILSDAAADDLDRIWIFGLNRWDLNQADRYHQKILDMLNFLCENPDLGKSRDELGASYQSYLVGSHVVFYRRYEQTIKVIRVLHQRTDSVRHLPN